jgi:hypothetical protein
MEKEILVEAAPFSTREALNHIFEEIQSQSSSCFWSG